MKNWICSLGLATLFFCSSCGPEIIFKQEQDIAPSGWTYSQPLNFQFEIADTSQLYNLFLTINHTTDFATQNLYVKIDTGFPDGQKTSQQLSIDMADKIGRWLGDCDATNCVLDIPIQTKAYFNQIGPHSFTLEQYMRSDSLAAISSVGFRIEVSDTKR